jgi:hypothetical protein
MNIFSVISSSENAELAARIDSVYNANKFKIGPNAYLVADSGVTAEEVANKLGVVEKKISGTVIVRTLLARHRLGVQIHLQISTFWIDGY